MTGDYINRQEEQARRDAIDSDRGKWIAPFAAGMGAIGLGAFLLNKRVAEGGEFISNMFNFLGAPKGISLASDAAANVGKSGTRGGNTGLRSLLNSTYDINRNRLNIGPIDIIDDLRNSVELMGMADGSMADHIRRRTTEYVNRELTSGGPSTGFFTKGLQRVTFGQVLEDQKTWSRVLGDEQLSVISRARQMGLVKSSMAIDKKLFYNKKTNEVLDFRLRNLTSKVQAVETQFGTTFQRVAKFDMFGQGDLLASMFGPRNRGIAVLGPGDGFGGS